MESRMKTEEREGISSAKVDAHADVVVIGGGLIGLALALELHTRGAAVTVVERGRCMGGASAAAAGMLAVEDPFNAPELRAFSEFSLERYPEFLRRVEEFSGWAVPFQTLITVQRLSDGRSMRLAEKSLDPRELGAALLSAVRASSIRVIEETRVVGVDGAQVRLGGGEEIAAKAVVFAAGAWTSGTMSELCGLAVPGSPRKGQMLRVKVPEGVLLDEVYRSEEIYVVPRTRGAGAGSALIGATVEDVGFDSTVRGEDLARLREMAAELVAELGSEKDAPQLEAWAGLRPATPDLLPVIGGCGRAGIFIASGHYRNGILLAPGTAVVMADLVEGKVPAIDIEGFSPDRFGTGVEGEAAQARRYSLRGK
jgi:glycine oxidase